MEFNWKPFNEAYKKTADKATFYETGAQDLAMKAAEKSRLQGETIQDRLGLLTEAQLQKAAPFAWTHESKGITLSQALADFAQKNGSKNPTFDAMIWISRLSKLCKAQQFPFDPDEAVNMSLTLENGNLTLFNGSAPILSGVPLFEAISLRKSNEAGRETVKKGSDTERQDLSETIGEEYLADLLYSTYTDAQAGEFPEGLAPIRELLVQNPSLDTVYLALQESHQGQKSSLRDYVGSFVATLENLERNREAYPERSRADLENLRVVIEVLEEVELNYLRAKVSEKEGRKELSNAENDAFIETNRESIRETADGMYELLGLDPSKIRRNPAVFLEMAIRRERNILDWKDTAQAMSAEYLLYTNPKGSIGALGIQPKTYLEALLLKNGMRVSRDYTANRLIAKSEGLIGPAESDIEDALNDPTVAIDIFPWILKKEVQKKDEPIEIILNKDGIGKKPYKLPIQETYTFASNLNKDKKPQGSVTFTHDEMRLLEALAKYQGDGLYLSSKDSEVPVDGENITDTRQLVLNNRTTYCLAGLT